MMLNPSGGMVGGDVLRTAIEVGENAAAILVSASAAKVYRTTGAAAVQETVIRLGRGAAVEYMPDHLIPHPGAVCHQSLRVDMAIGSRAIICDAIAAGRVGRGERWKFEELRSETVVARSDRPIYINRSRIVPAQADPRQLGMAEEFGYLATLIIADEVYSDWPRLVVELDDVFRSASGTNAGVSPLAFGGCVARMLCKSASDLNRIVDELWRIARLRLMNRGPFDPRRP